MRTNRIQRREPPHQNQTVQPHTKAPSVQRATGPKLQSGIRDDGVDQDLVVERLPLGGVVTRSGPTREPAGKDLVSHRAGSTSRSSKAKGKQARVYLTRDAHLLPLMPVPSYVQEKSIVPNDKYIPPVDGTIPPRGHQAYGHYTTSTGRRVPVYPQQLQALKASKKFRDNQKFAARLPELRRQYRKDLKGPDRPADAPLRFEELQPRQVLALAVALIDQACFRVGNEGSAAMAGQRQAKDLLGPDDDGGVYGLTTLKGKHLELTDDLAIVTYYGKDRVRQTKKIRPSPRLRAILTALKDACPTGDEQLLKTQAGAVSASMLRRYLKPLNLHPHQFRHFHASEIVFDHLLSRHADPRAQTPEGREELKLEAANEAAKRLGHETHHNTVEHYIDPDILAAWDKGQLREFASTWLGRTATQVAVDFLLAQETESDQGALLERALALARDELARLAANKMSPKLTLERAMVAAYQRGELRAWAERYDFA